MRLTKWEPLNEIAYLNNEINKIFNDNFVNRDLVKQGVWAPSVDVVETKEEYKVKVDLPGLLKEDIDVSLTDNILTIKGERKDLKEEGDDVTYYKKEITYGSFQRQVSLANTVDSENIKASYIDGVLEVKVPKTEKAKSRKISIE
jgi:HSP20 family protein